MLGLGRTATVAQVFGFNGSINPCNFYFQAFKSDIVMVNQYNPKLLEPPLSLSAYLRFGALSIRRFYWEIHELYTEVRIPAPYFLSPYQMLLLKVFVAEKLHSN